MGGEANISMDHFSKNTGIWPCVLGGIAVGAAGALALAHVWSPACCKPKEAKDAKPEQKTIASPPEKAEAAAKKAAAGKKVAVILAGCGVYDGAECVEATSTLIHLSALGCEVTCFAPDKEQAHVVNHTEGSEMKPVETRNVLVEAARIARGNITALNKLKVSDFDALIIPGFRRSEEPVQP